MTSRRRSGPAFAEVFGRNLSRRRRASGLSQEELGVRASLHRTAVGQLERGERVARADTLVKLAGSLGVPPEELLSGLAWTPGSMTTGHFGGEGGGS
jgi:transcriptional regulator with XRE-family HTH domain